MSSPSQDGPVDTTNTMRRVDARVRARLFDSDAPPAPPAAPAPELRVGDRIGRHIVLEYLGAGGMGQVVAAYDPRLDRKVAIKLVLLRAGRDLGDARARLLREAQALARLAHPNVVAVHDAGIDGEQVWISMDLVRGQTIREWVQERPRRWTEILRVLTEAALGVAAAHAAGLVHRDLKPDNVMIGHDGRVLVMDFGLANWATAGSTEPEPVTTSEHQQSRPNAHTTENAHMNLHPDFAAFALRLTKSGGLLGTPGYAAPEQWKHGMAGAAADQYSWSVMAWELLHGSRPREDVAASAPGWAPRMRQSVPGWLNRVIERGLTASPEHRWPTMAALLAALRRGRAVARLRLAAMVLIGIVVVGLGWEGYRRWELAEADAARANERLERVTACEEAGAAIHAVWNDEARHRLHLAFMATEVSYAQSTADIVLLWLDKHAQAWRQARTDACLNADPRTGGRWNAETFDRALWCLEERQSMLEALVAEFGRASPAASQRAVASVAGLKAIDDCMDEASLRHQPAPPVEGREAIQEVRTMLSQASALQLAGKLKEGLALAVEARERAENLGGWPPLLISATLAEGVLLKDLGSLEAAEAASTRAYFEAAHVGASELAAMAAMDLTYLVGYKLSRVADAKLWSRHAEVALLSATDGMNLLEARRLQTLAPVLVNTGAYAEALTLYERALAINEKALGPDHPFIATGLNNLASVHQYSGSPSVALTLYERALNIREKALGSGHPDVADSLNGLGVVLAQTGEWEASQRRFERALEITEGALGPDHPVVAERAANLANLHYYVGRHAQARSFQERALAIRERAFGLDHTEVAHSLSNLALVHMATGEYAKAKAMTERALLIFEAKTPGSPEVARCVSNLGLLHKKTGAYAQASAFYRRAIGLREQVLGANHPEVAQSLLGLGEVLLAQQLPQRALPPLERAVAILDGHAGTQIDEPAARFLLATALITTRTDRTRALIEAKKARDGFREAGADKAADLSEVEQWLASHER